MTCYDLLIKWWSPMPVAKRSGLPYIKHIDDGLKILGRYTSDQLVLDAFTIHPIVQHNRDVAAGFKYLADAGVSLRTLELALEYRRVANAYLPSHTPQIPEISPLPHVNLMLLADKAQNRSDLVHYNSGIQGYSNLLQYFNNWNTALLTK